MAPHGTSGSLANTYVRLDWSGVQKDSSHLTSNVVHGVHSKLDSEIFGGRNIVVGLSMYA